LELDTSKLGEFDFIKRPTTLQEIKGVEKLMDFKHDLQKISKSFLTQLEEKK